MTAACLWLAVSLVGATPPALEPGAVLTYRGQIVAVKGDADASRKAIELTLLVVERTADQTLVDWTLEEQGHGSWAWPDRFGQLAFDRTWRAPDAAYPALLYDRGDGKSVVGLTPPLLASPSGPLAKDASWEQGKLEHRVVGAEKRLERDTWKVEARNAYGVRRTYWVDQQSPVVVSLRERVFIGQGHEHELKLDLAASSTLNSAELATASAGFTSLVALRDKLGHTARNLHTTWNDQQLATLRGEQPALVKLAKLPLLATVAQAAEQDVNAQKNRSGAVASLREKMIGEAAPALKLEGIAGASYDTADAKTGITILHFWEYRDTPLEEPYGQTGYLDFLYRKWQKQGVRVYGVAVYDSADGSDARRRSMQAANRLKSFMNLSYPLLLDDGSALKKLGDPRVAGAKLPLFVVIGANGKVVEYHSGIYEVRPDRGLEQLDTLLTKSAGKRE